MPATNERFLLRAREPVARCLMRRLMVPKVYFDARWPDDDSQADIVLIDRGGVGDAHVVELRATLRSGLAAVPPLLSVPAQYRWIAVPRTRTLPAAAQSNIEKLHAEDGAGRVGVVEVIEVGNDLEANILVRAERFPGSLNERVDTFVENHEADIEYRPLAVGRRR